MKALEFLKQERAHHLAVHNDKSIIDQYDEAIKELEALQNENKSLKESIEKTKKQLDISIDLINKILEK